MPKLYATVLLVLEDQAEKRSDVWMDAVVITGCRLVLRENENLSTEF